MYFNTDSIYLKINYEASPESVKKFEQYHTFETEFKEGFAAACAKLLEDDRVNSSNLRVVSDPFSYEVIGIKIDTDKSNGYKLPKQYWKNIGKGYEGYYKPIPKMGGHKYNAWVELFKQRVPSDRYFNAFFIEDSEKIVEKFKDEDLFHMIFEHNGNTYGIMSRPYFKSCMHKLPEGIKITTVSNFTNILMKSQVKNFFKELDPEDLGEGEIHPVEAYKVSVVDYQGQYIIDTISMPVEQVHIELDNGDVTNVKLVCNDIQFEHPKIRVADILNCEKVVSAVNGGVPFNDIGKIQVKNSIVSLYHKDVEKKEQCDIVSIDGVGEMRSGES